MRISDWSSDVCSSDLKLVPPGDALRYPLFKATPRWTIEGFGCHLLRPIIVAGKTPLDIMVVGIALAITDVLHQLGRRVQNVLRRHQRSRVAAGFPCGLLRYRSEEHPSELHPLIRHQNA